MSRLGFVALLVGLLAGGCAGAETTTLFTAEHAAAATAIPTTPPIGIPIGPETVQGLRSPLIAEPAATPIVAAPASPTPVPVDTDRSDRSTPEPAATPRPDQPATPAATATEPAAATPQAEPTPSPTQPAATPTPAPDPTAAPQREPEPTEAPVVLERQVIAVGHLSLGNASGVALVLPVANIELIGFHEAGHPGSQAINPAANGVALMTLETRNRGTHSHSAADIVVPPGDRVVAPVTGTVVAAGSYVLYCDHDDALVYIEPDGLPGWQVRLFHVAGDLPQVGTRVIAGETVVADSARTLPFESQVDEYTAEPSWPHVHIEVVDTSVPDTRPPGPGCP